MRVAALVPAYDEENTVGRVVRTLKASSGIDEVIVVDDGSSDRTAEESEAAGADRVIRLTKNVGKGGAVKAGAEVSGADILFLCDADFLGLTPAHVERILKPVIGGKMAMCTGLRDRGPILTRVIAHLPLLSGERALRREVLDGIPKRFLRGFRIEIALNWYCRVNRLSYGSVPTMGVNQVRKIGKVGLIQGLFGYAVMIWQIAEAMISVRLEENEFLKR